jgi:hypothetical protein
MRAVFASVLGLSLLGACSPVPIAGTFPVTVEQRMQSVSHWQMVAQQTVGDAIARGLPQDRPVYVALSPRGEQCTFCIAFTGYVTTELMNHGYSVSLTEDTNASAVHYSLQAVPFYEWKDHEAIPGFFTLLAGGAWLGAQGATHWGSMGAPTAAAAAIPAGVALDLANGAFATPTDSELIVTVDVTSAGRVILRSSRNFYVAGADIWQYVAPPQDNTLVRHYSER